MFVIAIDGPSGSGKTSLVKGLVARGGADWAWVSTGFFYRALAYVAREEGVDFSDPRAVVECGQKASWEVKLSETGAQVIYQEKDIAPFLHTSEISEKSSFISPYKIVREYITPLQRKMAEGDHFKVLVADGRDCGTTIFPEAPIKIFLTASPEVRAQRRASEQGTALKEVVKQQQTRDERDSHREHSPLAQAKDALVIDNSHSSPEEVLEEVYSLIGDQLP